MSTNELVGIFFLVIVPAITGLIILIGKFISPINKLEIAIERLLIMLDQMKETDKRQDEKINKNAREINNLRIVDENHERRICALERECESK